MTPSQAAPQDCPHPEEARRTQVIETPTVYEVCSACEGVMAIREREAAGGWTAHDYITRAYERTANVDSMIARLHEYGYEIRPIEREAGAAQEKPTSPQRAFEKAVWRAIESYPGTVEIDNVQRFREHLWREPHPDSAVPFMAAYLDGIADAREAAAATPSLDVFEHGGCDTCQMDAGWYARLDEGSATPSRIREVVGQGDGTMIVTLDDGTERRITEQEYLDWPRER